MTTSLMLHPSEMEGKSMIEIGQTFLARIDDLDKAIEFSLQQEQVETPVIHHFGEGVCIREVFLPEGSFVVGHYHTKPTVNLFLKGKVLMLQEDGSTKLLEAPMIFTSYPGRKAGFIVEDVVWQEVWPSSERDIDKLEAEFVDKGNMWEQHHMLRFAEQIAHSYKDREDFKNLLKEVNITEEQIQAEMEAAGPVFQLNLPYVRITESPIHGKGLFVTKAFKELELIGPATVEGKKTELGRYINHSLNPNATFLLNNGDVCIIAIKDIEGCLGGGPGTEITVNYRESPRLAPERLTS